MVRQSESDFGRQNIFGQDSNLNRQIRLTATVIVIGFFLVEVDAIENIFAMTSFFLLSSLYIMSRSAI